jgi:hypothetical protein
MEIGAFFDFDFDVVISSSSTSTSITYTYTSIVEDTGRRERERARARTRRPRAARQHRRRQPAAIAPVTFAQNVAAGGSGPSAAAAAPAAPFDPNAEMCCIGVACKQPRPDFTWLPCCENNSVCMECIVEHIRHSGSTCPLCRGDLNV